MKNYICLLVVIINSTMLLGQSKNIYLMEKSELDSLLTIKSETDLTITERMNFYSGLFIGMPYGLTCVGDGTYALYDTNPLVRFDTTNAPVEKRPTVLMNLRRST